MQVSNTANVLAVTRVMELFLSVFDSIVVDGIIQWILFHFNPSKDK